MYRPTDQLFLILKSDCSGAFFYFYVMCLVCDVFFLFACDIPFYLFFLTFNAKPEGIEKEQTYNTLLCPQGKCNKTKFSD